MIAEELSRTEIREVAKQLLQGSVQIIPGCRELIRLFRDSNLPDSKAFDTVLAVTSETDDYLVGDIRAAYSPEFLSRLDAEIEVYVDLVRPTVFLACSEILRMLGACESSHVNTVSPDRTPLS